MKFYLDGVEVIDYSIYEKRIRFFFWKRVETYIRFYLKNGDTYDGLFDNYTTIARFLMMSKIKGELGA